MEMDGLPRVLRCVHLPLGFGVNPSDWLPLRRHLFLPLLDDYRFHAPAQIPTHLAEGVEPLKKLALQLHWLYPLLCRDFHPLRREALAEETSSLSQASPRRS